MIVIYKEFISLIVKIKLYIYIMSKNIYKYKIRYTNILGGSSSKDKINQNDLEKPTLNSQNLENSETENINIENLKFKNKDQWPEKSLIWTSQADYKFLKDLIWDENGVGKIISGDKIEFNNNSSYTKYSKKYIRVDNYSFKIDAFVEQDQKKLTIFLQNNGINLDENESENVATSSTSSTSSIPIPLDTSFDIFVIGESNHNSDSVKNQIQILKNQYKDAYIFEEGATKGDNIDELDEETSEFRAQLLFTSLFTKELNKLINEVIKKKMGLVANILRDNRKPEIEKLVTSWEEVQNNKSKLEEKIESLLPVIATLDFDFFQINDYYFGTNDPYYNEMKKLLSLSNDDAKILNKLGDKDDENGEEFRKITQEAREMKMVERVTNYMNQNDKRKVLIFTGSAHLNKLNDELSKKYSVKTMII